MDVPETIILWCSFILLHLIFTHSNFFHQVEKARHLLILRDKIQQEQYNTRMESDMGANVAESETTSSLDSTLSNDSIMDRERALMDKCLKLLMQNQAPLLTPPALKVTYIIM